MPQPQVEKLTELQEDYLKFRFTPFFSKEKVMQLSDAWLLKQH